MDILVTNQSAIDIEMERLKRLAEFVLRAEKVGEQSEVSVALVDPEKIQELNLRYRKIDRPTDVLSFDLSDDGKLSGEVVISPQVALENAAMNDCTPGEELESLLIHGLLHLLGFTHDHDDDAEAMFERHERIKSEYSAAGGTA